MAANFLEVATLAGGGLLGALFALYAAGQKFAGHLSDLANTIDKVLKDPRHADLATVLQKARLVEQDAKSLFGMIKQVFKA